MPLIHPNLFNSEGECAINNDNNSQISETFEDCSLFSLISSSSLSLKESGTVLSETNLHLWSEFPLIEILSSIACDGASLPFEVPVHKAEFSTSNRDSETSEKLLFHANFEKDQGWAIILDKHDEASMKSLTNLGAVVARSSWTPKEGTWEGRPLVDHNTVNGWRDKEIYIVK